MPSWKRARLTKNTALGTTIFMIVPYLMFPQERAHSQVDNKCGLRSQIKLQSLIHLTMGSQTQIYRRTTFLSKNDPRAVVYYKKTFAARNLQE